MEGKVTSVLKTDQQLGTCQFAGILFVTPIWLVSRKNTPRDLSFPYITLESERDSLAWEAPPLITVFIHQTPNTQQRAEGGFLPLFLFKSFLEK